MDNLFSMERIDAVADLVMKKIIEAGPAFLITLIAILICLKISDRLLKSGEERSIKRMQDKRPDVAGETEKRLRTLFAIARKTVGVTIWTVGALVILPLFGVPIGPIITAAGVLGLAVSFGAQALVRDLIAGTFILVENQIRVGDVALINGQGGLVEAINLRTVVLRDMQGTVHVFPNGTIDKLSNMTKDWSAFVIDMGVAYKEDPDKVMEVMKRVAAGMREDADFKDKIIADMEVMGLDNFGDSAIVIKARIKTKPIQQWAVGREYRRRLKRALDEERIEIPFPHRTLYFGEASPAFEVLARTAQEKDPPKDV